ncbi:MAG: RagB/SusD family nutrient uptake outer membrane protein [Pseudobacter sp.]|uniref:RagB/SusD family nutrient uptake outer membrane protein n=1 Tax=Pseudobacter sp. TaxID=2045420 RepID=UPI003F7D2061
MWKHFKYIALIALLATAAPSCKKWLDVTPGNQVRAEDQFASEAGFRDALMGVYISMTEKDSYGQNLTWGATDYLAQPYKALDNQALFYDFQGYRYKSVMGTLINEAIWKANYNTIANVNSMLQNMEKKKGEIRSISYSIMKGELLGLRAFLHFDLMRLYGRSNLAGAPEMLGKPAIPYVTEFSKQVTEQRNYTETFALLEKDLNDALALLKEDPIFKNASRPADYYDEVNRTGFFNDRAKRMNYYAVRALQARILLWEGNATKIAEAGTVAEDVIANSGIQLSRYDVIPKNVILKGEHLFALNIERFYDIVNPFLPVGITTTVNSVMISQDNMFSIYENNSGIGLSDFRQQEWFHDWGNPDRSRIPKKIWQNINDVNNRNIMPLIRLAEMYYIAAEAKLTTNLPGAIELINTVRRSRGIIQDIPANADLATATSELTKEYRKDFIQEGQLFYYYKRKGFTTFPGLPTTTPGNDGIYMLPYPDSEMEFGNRAQ